ncbi:MULTISPECIES: acetamidase/formamidase family protein [Bacillaceae]|uniref:acetamidase/formamidase family protein n=1 Tax=Bacillaceae TaxID=186817 RepID=UPI001E3AC7D4|nr:MULTISPECIES: acetamidase/formamidase family protein [Bacillaceae]MCE4047467.1 acetamidase/formamidase family protein [Bacillus sp. Au-Bac7]MCM3030743.1 acetamidase/formamidase family protein [Niallia sp. MER 6]MDL0435838.1 acetamidase/formamidase family protein [Niallia sp. SS-2023]UPO86183.1 acetamidase/formamidase family protein [Niallia sp. Man26]
MKHILTLKQENFHGSFSKDYRPVLTVESGDSIQLQTLDIEWGFSESETAEYKTFISSQQEKKPGHPMIGPIAVKNAQPGMVLEIKINEIVPGWYGRNWSGGIKNWQNLTLGIADEERIQLDWKLDSQQMTGSTNINGKTFTVALKPFMGVMGVAPMEEGVHATPPPRYCGGNIDCKELVKGSSLFLPVAVEHALFSIGDGHALQGDGEISGTAIECPMELVDITLIVRNDMKLKAPIAKTPSGWITLGFNEDLNIAAADALNEMISFMQNTYQINRTEAAALASAAVDLRITQVVNGVKGVHAVLPFGAIRS